MRLHRLCLAVANSEAWPADAGSERDGCRSRAACTTQAHANHMHAPLHMNMDGQLFQASRLAVVPRAQSRLSP